MSDFDIATDDAKLLNVLAGEDLAHPAWWFAERAGVSQEYAELALARMADESGRADPPFPLVRRPDLGPDVYERTE